MEVRELARLRRAFTILFVGIGLLSAGTAYILDVLSGWIGLFVIVQGIRASVAWHYGQRLRLPGAFWLGLAAFIPGSFWPVFCTIRGWRPATLSTAAPAGGRLEGWVKGWMTAYAALPLIAFIIILLTNAFYLFEYLSRPSGLIMLLLWLVFYIPGIVGLRQLYWKGRGDNGWQFGLVVALLSIGNAIGIYVAWLGPAFIWLVDQLR